MMEGNVTKEKALVIKKDDRIAAWGERAEIREIARRVQMMAPGARRLNENEALALAQGAVAHGLDPFNGEIWFIPGSGLMAGIKGLRKAARKQLEGNFWVEFEPITDPDKRSLYMIPDGALAFMATLRDTETLRTYAEAWAALTEKGVDPKIIPAVLGKRPSTIGIGYFKKGEASKMNPVQCAMKRAEADAIKRRFDLPFATPTTAEDEALVDGEWAESSEWEPVQSEQEAKLRNEELDRRSEEISREDRKARARKGAAALYGEGEEADPTKQIERPLSPETLRALMAKKVAKHEGHKSTPAQFGLAMGTLNLCFAGDANSDDKRHSVLAYLFGKDTGKDLTDGEVLALLDWLKPTREREGEPYLPDGMAAREAQAVVAAMMKELGQVAFDLEQSQDAKPILETDDAAH